MPPSPSTHVESGRPPLLRWAGSKRATAGSLALFWRPNFGKYIEPFCGSAALFFNIAPKKAVLGDINGELIAFYQTVSSRPLDVYREFSKYPRRRDFYYRLRSQYEDISDRATKSAVFYYLNKNCFNGLYRTNKKGAFNVPFSDNRVGRYPSRHEFLKSCELLSQARFRCGDFADVVSSSVQEGDFVYLDPPYASSKRRPFREYHPDSFSVDDIHRLGELLLWINHRRANFVLTYGQLRIT
jgi:DNA adenine methylase